MGEKMKIIIRMVYIALSLIVAYNVFFLTYNEFYSYLPSYQFLNTLNSGSSAGTVLRENSTSLRELYNHAFEMSLIYSIISFVGTIVMLEYIRVGNFFAMYFGSMKKDIKEIRGSL